MDREYLVLLRSDALVSYGVSFRSKVA